MNLLEKNQELNRRC